MPHATNNQKKGNNATSSLKKALIASEIRYRRLFESAKDGILILDAGTGMIVDVNPFLTNLLGYPKENFIQKTIWEIGLLKDIVQNKDKFLELQQNEYVRYEDLPLETAEGRKIHVEFVSNVYLVNNQKVIQCNIRDITERKLSEKTIFEAHKMLRTLIDNLPALIYIKDVECRKVIANVADVKNIGYKREEDIIGKTDIELLPGDIGHRGYMDDQEVINSGNAIFNKVEDFVDSKGKINWISTSKIPLRNNEGEITGLVGIGHDITERKILEMNLSTATEIAKLGYWEYDVKSGDFIFDDHYYRLIHGSSAEKQGGNTMNAEEFARRLVHPDDSKMVVASLNEAINSPIPEYLGQTEARVFRDNGDVTNVMVQFKAVKDRTGQTIKIVGINQDITEQKRFEQELMRAKEKAEESDRLKSAFLANMSHEIRTPMNGILGFTELLKAPELTGEKQQRFINIIEKSGARMLNIINDIISISRIESGEVQLSITHVNIDELAKDIVDFFKPEAEKKVLALSYKKIFPENQTSTKTDKEKVYAVLANLVKNAIKFTETGSIEIGAEKKGKFIEFFVKDTGSGVPQEQQEIIFERFRQGSESTNRNYEGAGLGLAISKAYVKLLGGEIWIERNNDQGAIFYFTIPYPDVIKEKEQLKAMPEEVILNHGKLKILIAEDDEASQMLLEIIISPLASESFYAYTGKEAVELCRKHPEIDLVLMDIDMPGMNGYEATRQIRKFNKEVIIFAQTAYGLSGDKDKALKAGCNDYISKPIDKRALLKMIEKRLRKENVGMM